MSSPDPRTAVLHQELETPGGLVYALIEERHTHPDPDLDRPRKVLALQPANGSGEPTGQPCLPERLELGHPRVDRLVKLYPHIAGMVEEARAAQPEPARVPTITELQGQVLDLQALLRDLPDQLLRQLLAQREPPAATTAPATEETAQA